MHSLSFCTVKLPRKMIERVNVNEDCTIEIHFRFGAIVTKQLESARVRD